MYNNDKNKNNFDNLCYLYEIEKNKNGIIIEFSENKLILKNNKTYNGKWYMSIVCEFSDLINSRFLVYSKFVNIKDGVIEETIKNDSKKGKIIIICSICIIIVFLGFIFYYSKTYNEINLNPNISLINMTYHSYRRFNV